MSPYAPWDDSTSGSKPLWVRTTAATSAGSTSCSAAASRMVSSYSRGWVNRRARSGVSNTNGSPRRTSARTTSNTNPRLRSLRDRPYLLLLFGATFADGTPPTERPIHERIRLLPEFIQVPVIFHHNVCTPSLLLARKLAALYRAALLLPHAPLLSPPSTPLVGRRDRDGIVELLTAPTLEEQRYLGHEDTRAGFRRASLGLLAHPRVEHLLEVPQGLGIPEDLPTQSLAVYTPLAAHPFPEAPRNGVYRLFVPGQKLVDHLVSRDGLRAQFAQGLH